MQYNILAAVFLGFMLFTMVLSQAGSLGSGEPFPFWQRENISFVLPEQVNTQWLREVAESMEKEYSPQKIDKHSFVIKVGPHFERFTAISRQEKEAPESGVSFFVNVFFPARYASEIDRRPRNDLHTLFSFFRSIPMFENGIKRFIDPIGAKIEIFAFVKKFPSASRPLYIVEPYFWEQEFWIYTVSPELKYDLDYCVSVNGTWAYDESLNRRYGSVNGFSLPLAKIFGWISLPVSNYSAIQVGRPIEIFHVTPDNIIYAEKPENKTSKPTDYDPYESFHGIPFWF